jgi:hypothetical protein
MADNVAPDDAECVLIEQFPRGVCTISSNNLPMGPLSLKSPINSHLLPASETLETLETH